MPKLKLGPIESDKPVKLSIQLPASVHRDLIAYGEVHALQTGQVTADLARLIPAMLARFMATDRGFRTTRWTNSTAKSQPKPSQN